MALTEQLNLSIRFFKYWLIAVNDHSLHAPFAYTFYNEIIAPARKKPVFPEIESLREQFLSQHEFIEIEDLGAGSTISSSNRRKISEIVKGATSESKIARLLYHSGQFLNAQHVVELGTSLGITTQYLAEIGEGCNVHSFEGANEIHKLANTHLSKRSNVTCHLGNIDSALPKYLEDISHIDLAYLDANHTFEATMRYTDMLMPKLLSSSILVVGDIHWSAGMEQAWESLKNLKQVTISMDLFQCGLLFFVPVKEKQHYVIWF